MPGDAELQIPGELSEHECQVLRSAIENLDKAAKTAGLDVLVEFENGPTMSDVFALIVKRQHQTQC